MADVAVVGAGLAGLATAARVAKLGHTVTVLERGGSPGGLLTTVRDGDYAFDATPFQTTIPAVLRDLFRSSGRPLERYVDLQLDIPTRRHVFADGTTLDLPTGSRGAQVEAVTAAIGPAAARSWTTFVDGLADRWAVLRAELLDPPNGIARLGDRRLARAIQARRSLDQLLRKELSDARLRQVAAYPVLRTGGTAADRPAMQAVHSYVERSFGVWRLAGGADTLATALLTRLAERSVDVRFGAEVSGLVVTADRVTGVQLSDGARLRADLTVTTVPPETVFGRLLPESLVTNAEAGLASAPRTIHPVSHLGLAGPLPTLPAEVVLHGDPLVVVTTRGSAPAGHQAWTVVVPRATDLEVLDLLATRGLDVRGNVVTRVDGRVVDHHPAWSGARDAAARAALAQTIPGLHCLGTGLILGSSVPYVAWQAAHVGDLVGKA